MRVPIRVTVAAVLLGPALLASGCGGNDTSTARQDAGLAITAPRSAAPSTGAADVQAGTRAVLDDAEADQAHALPAGVKLTKKAPAPGAAKAAAARTTASSGAPEHDVSPGAPTDAEIAADLKQMEKVQKQQAKNGGTAHGITLNPDGTATPAPGVPAVVARVIAGANAIAKFPYVYGGGHGSFVDTAYDCSGSLSYALAAGGLLTAPKTSGDLARTGAKGPGKWITIYANAGHTFMYVDGLRYDTSGRSGPRGSRWNTAPRSLKGFTVTHPPGL
ncbi:MAG: hypothetical protein JWM31_801 [Solirubrobacterales bacterium]|nr:hypothetical protein [Solirubrobacterales bacterium]